MVEDELLRERLGCAAVDNLHREWPSGAGRGADKDDRTGGLMRVGANMLPDTKSVHDVIAYINNLKP